MKTIITINREFSSGGREVAKRVADELGFHYYDDELISAIAKDGNLSEEFVKNQSEVPLSVDFPFVFGRTVIGSLYMQPLNLEVQIAQSNLIKEIGDRGNAVIVGRLANDIIEAEKTLDIFIYSSDMEKRVNRYLQREEKKDVTEKEIKKIISKVDKERSKYYEQNTCNKWKNMNNYALCIDTSIIEIKQAAKIIASALKTINNQK